jgi:hypothetical protein
MTRGTYIWVHPEFKKVLKHRAADNNKSVFELTKDMARDFGVNPFSTGIKKKAEEYRPRF